MSVVLILSGPPGAGKTTVAGLLASEADRGVHIESDEFFRFVKGGYADPSTPASHEQNEVVMRAVADAAAAYAKGGWFTVVEGIISPKWFMAPVRDRIRDHGLEVGYAILRPPLEVCVARDRQDTEAVLRRLYGDFDGMEAHELDTARLEPAEAAREIRARLEAGALAI